VLIQIGQNSATLTPFGSLGGCVYRKLKHARSDGEARRGSYMT
jgi:hypothetical protein